MNNMPQMSNNVTDMPKTTPEENNSILRDAYADLAYSHGNLEGNFRIAQSHIKFLNNRVRQLTEENKKLKEQEKPRKEK